MPSRPYHTQLPAQGSDATPIRYWHVTSVATGGTASVNTASSARDALMRTPYAWGREILAATESTATHVVREKVLFRGRREVRSVTYFALE